MVVAVIAVRVVEVAVDNVVDVVAVRSPRDHNRGHARDLCRDQRSCEPVYSRRGLCQTHRVDVRLHGPHGGGEVAITQIVDVVAVFNGGMSTVWSMHMCVVRMFVACVIESLISTLWLSFDSMVVLLDMVEGVL